MDNRTFDEIPQGFVIHAGRCLAFGLRHFDMGHATTPRALLLFLHLFWVDGVIELYPLPDTVTRQAGIQNRILSLDRPVPFKETC